MGQSRMERFPKQWKHLQWRWTKAFLSVARVARLCSTGLGCTCIKSCYYPIYCNPFAMSGLGFLLRSPCLTCTMGRSDGRKERCDCSLLMRLYGWMVQQLLPVFLEVLARTIPSTVDLHVPFHYFTYEPKPWLKNIGNNTVANIMSFRFHWGHNW